MRIVGGSLGSRRLTAPRGPTRPTSDRARESLFAALGPLDGARCLDLFAGSGALGLEALSRGAAHCTFCEVDRAALAALRRNVTALGVEDRARVRALDARRLVRAEAETGARYDLVLVDPPYRALQHFLPTLERHLSRLVAPDGRIVIESAAGDEVAPAGFSLLSRRRVGAASLAILTPTPGPAP